MLQRKVTLIETQSGWMWAERGVTYKTLVSAKRAILREDVALSRRNCGCVTILTLMPTTPGGTLLVKALA